MLSWAVTSCHLGRSPGLNVASSWAQASNLESYNFTYRGAALAEDNDHRAPRPRYHNGYGGTPLLLRLA